MAASSNRGNNRPSEQQQYDQFILASVESRNLARVSSDRYKFTNVGSGASSLGMKGSDIDILIECNSDFIIDESLLDFRDDLPCYLKIPVFGLPDNTPTFFHSDDTYLLTDLVRNQRDCNMLNKPNLQDSKVGKVFTESEGQIPVDLVPQLRLSAIPRTARRFSTRDRFWPPDRIITMITNGEFHVITRPAPNNPDPNHDFCLSFSKAEVILGRAMSPNQLSCVKFLKNIKGLIDNGQHLLTSYHMKTVAMWYFEKTASNTLDTGLQIADVLKKLDIYLDERFLPHYFVPAMNLFVGISDSAILEVRRRLHSFLGISLVSNEPTRINSFAGINVAMFITQQLRFAADFEDSESIGILQNAESLYISNERIEHCDSYDGVDEERVMKQELSASIVRKLLAYSITPSFQIKFTELRKTIKGTSDERVRAMGLNDPVVPEYAHQWTAGIRDTLNEPLDKFFPLGFDKTHLRLSRYGNTELKTPKHIMEKWISFADNLVDRLISHVNSVVDQLLVGIWVADILFPKLRCVTSSTSSSGDSHVDSDRCELDPDNLFFFDHVTKGLLASVVEATDEFPPVLYVDMDAHAFLPTGDFETSMNIQKLKLATEELFIHIEYVIVENIRSRNSGVSPDDAAQLLSQSNLECQCLVAYQLVLNLILHFHMLHSDINLFHGLMEFFSHTRRMNCRP